MGKEGLVGDDYHRDRTVVSGCIFKRIVIPNFEWDRFRRIKKYDKIEKLWAAASAKEKKALL